MQSRDVVIVSGAVDKHGWQTPRLSIVLIAEITAFGTASNGDASNGRRNVPGSDVRLKRDIREVGASPNGLTLYSFRYNWSEEMFVGVMAQEVLELRPEAVITREDGFYAVDYDMLGLKMISLDKWRETKRIH